MRQELYCEDCHNVYLAKVACPNVLPNRICTGCHEKRVGIGVDIRADMQRLKDRLVKQLEPSARRIPMTVAVPQWLIDRYKILYGEDWRQQLDRDAAGANVVLCTVPSNSHN